MILCFSGTGNSRFVANRIARITGDRVLDINARIKGEDYSAIQDTVLVFVVPTYAWRIPKLVEAWVRKVTFPKNARAWFVMTCGGNICNAKKYNRQLCRDKGLVYQGTAPMVMPENYVAMFRVPDVYEAGAIIKRALPSIEAVGQQVKAGRDFEEKRSSVLDVLLSGPINGLFYGFEVGSKRFRVTKGRCIGCGTCAKRCPVNAVSLVDGKPMWGKGCTHCMACISWCPASAIEYGKASVGKPRLQVTEHFLEDLEREPFQATEYLEM